MAGAAFPHPFNWVRIADVGPAHGHLIDAAGNSLRLGHLLQLHLHDGFLKKLVHLGDAPLLKDPWWGRTFQFDGVKFLQSSNEAFSSTFSACVHYLNRGGRRIKGFGNKSISNRGGRRRKASGSDSISDSDSSRRNPFDGRKLTSALIAVNVLAYIAQLATQGKLMLWGAKINSLIDKGQLWRLVTSSFLHANVGHLLINSYSLNSVGPTVESICGPRRFLAVYFISAVASSASSYRFCNSPAVGASGAIFGLVGSVAVYVMRHKGLMGGGKDELQHIAKIIALNMAIGLMTRGIDNWGHLGGLLGGAAASWLVGPAWKYESQTRDGRRVLVDRPPISHLVGSKSNSRKLK